MLTGTLRGSGLNISRLGALALETAPRFWERLASLYPPSTLNGYTALHPATSYRLSVMDKIIADVRNKQAGRQPLLP